VPVYAFKWTGEKATTKVDLPDEHAAWSQAVMTTGQMMRELDGSFPMAGELEVEVLDEAGRSIGWLCVKAGKGPH